MYRKDLFFIEIYEVITLMAYVVVSLRVELILCKFSVLL